MKLSDKDRTYNSIVNDILNNEEFNKIKSIEHHGVSRFDHSVKVSYFSYKLAKILGLNYEEVARAGLLHDFFLNDNQTTKEKITSTFVHPKKAMKNAVDHFNVNEKEQDIIKSHMFPLNASVPKYAESWVVNVIDKVVGTYEFTKKFGYKLVYVANLYVLFFMNVIK